MGFRNPHKRQHGDISASLVWNFDAANYALKLKRKTYPDLKTRSPKPLLSLKISLMLPCGSPYYGSPKPLKAEEGCAAPQGGWADCVGFLVENLNSRT